MNYLTRTSTHHLIVACRKPPLSRLSQAQTRARYAQYSTSHSHAHAHRQHGVGRQIKSSYALTAAFTASFAAFVMGALYPPDTITLLSPRPAPPPPDPNHPASQEYVASLEEQLQKLPIVTQLQNAPDAGEWYETRPFTHYPEAQRVNALTAGALRGPGKLALFPLLRVKRDESESVAVLHFGRGLCGHDGIIHGGLIATVLDESLGRLAIMNTEEKVAVTATLTVDYKAPTRADQFVVVRCKLKEVKGRRVYVEGHVEDLSGTVLATAKALFIQPKYAKLLNVRPIQQALGEPPVTGAVVSGGDPAPVPPDPVLDHAEKKA